MSTNDETTKVNPKIDRAHLVSSAARGELTKELLPLVRDDRHGLADTLASMHEESAVDVLGVFSTTSLVEVRQHDFFLLLMLYAELLPKIDAGTETVMALTAGLVDRAGEDLAAGEPYGAFRAWCANNDARPISALVAIESLPRERGRFARIVLEAGAAQDPAHYVSEALRLVDHDEPLVRSGALSALATMDLPEQPNVEAEVLTALRRQIDGSADPVVMVNALGALIERCLAAGESRLPMLLRAIGARPEMPLPLEQQVYARTLAMHGATLPPALLDALLYRLRRLERQHGGIIQHIDAALSRHRDTIGTERTSRALIAMLDESGESLELDDFRSLYHELHSSVPNALRGQLLLDALREGNFRASQDVGSLFAEINDRRIDLSLDVRAFGLPDNEIVRVCRRATVVLPLAPRALLDLLLDSLNVVGKRAAAEIGELLVEPVGLNHPETVRRELTEREKRRTLSGRKAVASAVRRIDAYVEGIDEASEVVELHPSALERRAVYEREFRSMRDTHARARERSFFAMFATQVDILYGNAVATYTPAAAADHPATRQEVRFSSMTASMEMPRLRALDPAERLLAIQKFSEE